LLEQALLLCKEKMTMKKHSRRDWELLRSYLVL
jgi:hypothetical protein